MKSTASRQRRKAKREAKRQRILMLLVDARMNGINIEPLKGLPEYVLRERLELLYQSKNMTVGRLLKVPGGWAASAEL